MSMQLDKIDVKFKQYGNNNQEDDLSQMSHQSLDDIFEINKNNQEFIKQQQKKTLISRTHFIMKQLNQQQYLQQQQKQDQKKISNILFQPKQSMLGSQILSFGAKQLPVSKTNSFKQQMPSIQEEQDKKLQEQQQAAKNIFFNVQKPIENQEQDNKNTPFFASGPRFNEEGDLIKYSIVGKPEWFASQSNKERKKQPQLDLKMRKNTIENDKGLGQSQLLMIKQNSSQTIKGADQKSVLGYKKRKDDLDPTKERVTKEQLLMQLDKLERKIYQQDKNVKDKVMQLTLQHRQVPQLIDMQNQAKDERILQRCEETDKKWFQTTNKIAKIAGRPLQDTLIARSGVEHRKRREESDLIDSTKSSLQLVGQNYFWETTLRQPITTPGSAYLPGLSIMKDQNSLQDQQMLSVPTRLTKTSQSTRSNKLDFGSQSMSSIKQHTKNNYSTTFGGDDAVRMFSGSNGTIVNTVVPDEYEKIIRPKLLMKIPLTRPQTTPNEQIEQEFSKKVPDSKRHLANYFQIKADDLAIKGESVLKKERDALCRDGLPQFQVYIKHKTLDNQEPNKSVQLSQNQVSNQDIQVQEQDKQQPQPSIEQLIK